MGKVVPEWRPLVERIIKAFEEYVHEDDPTWEADESLWQEIINIVSDWFKKPPVEQALWAKCDECDWGPYRYETPGQAKTALASHKRQKHGISDLKKRLEVHYKREMDLISEVMGLSHTEIQEIVEWVVNNPIWQQLKEVKELSDLIKNHSEGNTERG